MKEVGEQEVKRKEEQIILSDKVVFFRFVTRITPLIL